jgi:alpha-L-rhamnosidase
MFGEIGAWFYKALGGIRPDPEQPGFRNILLKPNFITGLTHSSVAFESPRGRIVSEWERKRKTVTYKLTIPANSTASLTFPDGFKVKKASANGNEEIKPANEGYRYQLFAGKYTFTLTK